MKILIATLPRSGSKFFDQNLNAYVSKLGLTSKHYYRGTSVESHGYQGLGEFLLRETRSTKYQVRLTASKSFVDTMIKVTNYEEEIDRRIELLKTVNCSFVIKEHCISGHSFDKLTAIVDRTYFLKRDKVEHILSNLVAAKTGVYMRTADFDQLVEDNTKNKFHISSNMVDVYLQAYRDFENLKSLSPHTQVLNFERLISIKTPEDFCVELNLPIVDFDFQESEIEYGQNKMDMIQNLDEVLSWIKFR